MAADSAVAARLLEVAKKRMGHWTKVELIWGSGPYLLLVACGAVPLLWFRDGHPIKSVDSYFSMHPQGIGLLSLYAWDARASTGIPTSDVIAWGITNLQAGLSGIGVPIVVIEATVLVVLSLSALLGMYRLSVVLLDDLLPKSERSWISVAVAIAWVANPFSLSFVWFHQLLTEFTWATLPWLVYLMVISVSGQPGRKLRDVLPLVVLVLTVGSAGFVHAYLPAIGLLFAITGLGIIAFSGRRTYSLQMLSAFAAAVLVGVSWWLLPSLPLIPTLVSSANIGPNSQTQLLFASQFSDLPNVLSLTAVPALHQTVNGVPYMSWAPLLLERPGYLLKFLLPSIALVGAAVGVSWRQTRGISVAAAACVGVGALFSKGYNWPMANLSEMLTQIPFGEVFRHPLDKFSFLLILPMCLLFGLGLAALVRNHLGLLAIFAGAIICGYLALPWWTGDVIPKGGGLLPSAHVEMPNSYAVVGRDLDSSPAGGKTMVLPYSRDGQSAFRWATGIQPNLDCLFQDWAPNRSLLCHATGQKYADLVPDALVDAISRGDSRAIELARIAGIDRWLVHNDWNEAYLPTNPTSQTALASLQALPVASVRSTTELSLFSQNALPLIYTAHSVLVSPDLSQPSELLSAASQMASDPLPVAVPVAPSSPLDVNAQTSWARDDPTGLHGVLSVRGTAILVFLESSDPNWRLTVDGRSASEASRLLANGFGNAWVVSGDGLLSWRLDYDLQTAVTAGNLAGGGLMVLSLFVIAARPVLERRKSEMKRVRLLDRLS